MWQPGVISTSTVEVSTEDSLSTMRRSLWDCRPSTSDLGVRSTTRSPSSSRTAGRSRRSEASPRRTSITRALSRAKMSTPSSPLPTRAEPSGIATSVKNFILLRPDSSCDIESRSGSRRGAKIIR